MMVIVIWFVVALGVLIFLCIGVSLWRRTLCYCELCGRPWRRRRGFEGESFKRVLGGERLGDAEEFTPMAGTVVGELCPSCSKLYREQMDDLIGGHDD